MTICASCKKKFSLLNSCYFEGDDKTYCPTCYKEKKEIESSKIKEKEEKKEVSQIKMRSIIADFFKKMKWGILGILFLALGFGYKTFIQVGPYSGVASIFGTILGGMFGLSLLYRFRYYPHFFYSYQVSKVKKN